MCCGSSVIEKNDYDYYDYNERYTNCGATVCAECLSNFKCDFCEQLEANVKHYKVFLEGEIEAVICEDCATNYIKKCPDCGRPTFINHLFGFYSIFRDEEINAPQSFIQIDSSIDNTEFEKVVSTEEEILDHRFRTIYPICRCGECAKKDPNFELKTIKLEYRWRDREDNYYLSKKIAKKEDWEKYLPYNLEPVQICDGEVIIN